MNEILKLFQLISIVIIGGCSGLISQPREDVPVEEPMLSDRAVQSDDTTVTPGAGELLQIDQLGPVESLSGNNINMGIPAVIALLESAEQERQSGKVDIAASTIERALRMEPKNALLWTRLAEIRLTQNNWQQAYVLANKSNSLAGDNRKLQIQNWQIIEKVKIRQGDRVAIEQARNKIRELSD